MPTSFNGTRVEQEALNAFVKLLRAADTLSGLTHRHLTAKKLTVSQFGVLETLHHLGPLCQAEVAKKNLKSTANMTTVIDNLEKRGLVERHRNDADRRYITLHLTSAGKDLIEELFPIHVQGIVDRLNILTPQEQQQLGQLCKKLGTGQQN